MKLLNFNIIKLTLCLILGIVFSYCFAPTLENIVFGLLLSTVVFCSLYFWQHRKFQQPVWFGVFTFITFFFIGILVHTLNTEKIYSSHYTNLLKTKTPQILVLKIKERLKPGLYHEKYIAEVLKIDTVSASGKLLLNVAKDSTATTYPVDYVISGKLELNPIQSPLNPHQFDYRLYLEKDHVYQQVFAESKALQVMGKHVSTIYGMADKLRHFINEKLKAHHFSPSELALINALLMGQRQEIEKEIYTHYVNAGAVHILAISGLHIGIILLLLNAFFKPLTHLKYGFVIRTVLLVVILWCFALVAGFSPSVTRAVTMFTIIAIALNMKRPTNIYNTLAISMFIILLFKPMFLFEVGFQLSYMAVLGIVSVQPVLYRMLPKPKWKLFDIPWKVFTVTVAAQFGILPISLFYFHQFPGLFFLTNLIIIPFLGIILGLGILILIMAAFNILPYFLSSLYGEILSGMSRFVSWVAAKEAFLLENIAFGSTELVVFYFLIFSIVLFVTKPNPQKFITVLVAIVAVQLSSLYRMHSSNTSSLIVFHKSRHSVLGIKEKNRLKVYHTLPSLENEMFIKNFRTGEFIKHFEEDSMYSAFHFKNTHILVVDSLGVYPKKTFIPDYVLLRNSPKINLNRLIDSIHPKQIIADGSNYKSYVNRWKATCKKRKLPFHNTNEKGAFVIK